MRLSGGKNTGGILDFSATGGHAPQGRRMEMKICEGYCGGLRFCREVPASADRGDRLCASCVVIERLERQMERRRA